MVVQSLGDPRAAGLEPGTSESRASVAARIAALRALRSATRRNGQSARDAAASGVFGEPLAGALEAAAAEDATGAFATRSVDTADRSAHDADASVDPMSVALREADVAPPGACLAEAFGVLRGFVVADRGVPGEADADLESDRAVREGLLPAIVRAALASIADLNGRLNRDGNVRREASSAGPRSEEMYGEARREREALSSVSAADAFAGSEKSFSRDAGRRGGVGVRRRRPRASRGRGRGRGRVRGGHGQSLRGQRGGGRAFGGAFGGSPAEPRDRSGGAGGFAAANPPADPEAVRGLRPAYSARTSARSCARCC